MFLTKKIKSMLAVFALLMSVVFVPFAAHADATPEQAKAMAEKAAQYVRDHGTEAATAEFNKAESEFIVDDLYVFVVDETGTFLSHPKKPALVGKNMIGLKDVDGIPLIQHFTEVEGEAWVEYKWPHPGTRQVTPKKSYIINVDGYIVGVGAYY